MQLHNVLRFATTMDQYTDFKTDLSVRYFKSSIKILVHQLITTSMFPCPNILRNATESHGDQQCPYVLCNTTENYGDQQLNRYKYTTVYIYRYKY